MIDSTIDFLLNDFNSWTPIPCESKGIVLIPEIESAKFLWSFTVKLSWTDTKYDSLGISPPIASWLFVL